LASAYRIQRSDLQAHLFGPGGMLEQWKKYREEVNSTLEIHSPSRWTERIGQEMIAGFDRSGFNAALTDMIGDLSGMKVTAPALPSVPPPSQTNVQNTKSYNLEYQGAQQDLTSIQGLFTLMEVASGG